MLRIHSSQLIRFLLFGFCDVWGRKIITSHANEDHSVYFRRLNSSLIVVYIAIDIFGVCFLPAPFSMEQVFFFFCYLLEKKETLQRRNDIFGHLEECGRQKSKALNSLSDDSSGLKAINLNEMLLQNVFIQRNRVLNRCHKYTFELPHNAIFINTASPLIQRADVLVPLSAIRCLPSNQWFAQRLQFRIQITKLS